VKLVCVMSVLP